MIIFTKNSSIMSSTNTLILSSLLKRDERIYMKKLMLLSLGLLLAFAFAKTYAQTSFTQAIKTCEEYKNQGSIRHKDEIFNI